MNHIDFHWMKYGLAFGILYEPGRPRILVFLLGPCAVTFGDI